MTDALYEAKRAIEGKVGVPEVALVLGSGLGGFADQIDSAVSIHYDDVPGKPASGISGHAGQLVAGTIGDKHVVAMQGRVHLYEGRSPDDVVFGVRLMSMLGAKRLIVTNSAGGIDPSFVPGDLMLIHDQLNLTGRSLTETHDDAHGPRFIDMTQAYDPEFIETADRVASSLGFELRRGVYAGLLGPAYETAAEVRMMRTLGADAVGMSTVLEVMAARQRGLRVLGISCITNLGTGLSPNPLTHDEVKEVAARSEARFVALLTGVVEAM